MRYCCTSWPFNVHSNISVHRNPRNVQILSDHTLIDAFLVADYLRRALLMITCHSPILKSMVCTTTENNPCYVAAAKEIARRLLKTRDMTAWTKVATEHRAVSGGTFTITSSTNPEPSPLHD